MINLNSMEQYLIQRRFSFLGRSITLATALALVLAGCAPSAENPQDVPPPAAEATTDNSNTQELENNQGIIAIQVHGEHYEFTPQFCSVTEDDILVHGPGENIRADGVAYLDIDITTMDSKKFGEIRIDHGVTEQFSSSDEFYLLQISDDSTHLIISDGDDTTIVGMWIDQNQNSLSEGRVVITC